MNEPSFKLGTGLCWDVRLDLTGRTDEMFSNPPSGCVGEGPHQRQSLALPFMRYAGSVCRRLMVFSIGPVPSRVDKASRFLASLQWWTWLVQSRKTAGQGSQFCQRLSNLSGSLVCC